MAEKGREVKKLLLIIGLMLVVMLSGCKEQEPKKSIEGWALQYAEEEYNRDYDGYVLFGYIIKEHKLYDVENDYEEYTVRSFEITFIDDSGKNVIYNVVIAYEPNGYPPLIEFKAYKESNIVDVDIEKSYDYHEDLR